MMFDYIKLTNFRQYIDDEIKLPQPKGKKNFIIIEGANGSGKTNILNAITWCLYGEELHLDKKNVILPIVNTVALNKKPKNCLVEVEIQMFDNERKKIKFIRRIQYQKVKGIPKRIPDVQANSTHGSRFEIIRQIGNDMKVIGGADAEYIVQQLIPRSLEEYFLFDGERLERYFKEKSGERIKEEVFKISQLELFEKVIEHLNNVEKDSVRTSKKLAPEIKKIENQLFSYSNSLKNFKKELDQKIILIEGKQKIEKELSEKIKSVPETRRLQEERERLEEDLKGLKKMIDDNSTDKLDFLINSAFSIFSDAAVKKVLDMIEKEDIPPDMDRKYLEKIIKKGKCICGNDISKKNNKCRKNVEKLLKTISEISGMTGELIDLKSQLISINDDLRGFDKERVRYGKNIKKLEDDFKKKSKRLKILTSKIKSEAVKEKQLKKWEDKLEETKKEIKNLNQEIGEYRARITMAEKDIKTLKSSRDKELKKSHKYDEIRRVISFCDSALEVAEIIKKEIMEDTRKKIEKMTKKEFFNLIWKKKTWKDVIINENYDVSVIHQSGLEGLGSLSRGEMQALALSFIGALSTVSGFDPPIIIDTPLGRLSSEVKKNIAQNLPNYLENKQVIILMTDEEYSPEVRKSLSKRLASEYKIKFKDSSVGSEAWVEKYDK